MHRELGASLKKLSRDSYRAFPGSGPKITSQTTARSKEALQGTNKRVERLSIKLCGAQQTMRILSHNKAAANRVDISNDGLARHWRKYFGTRRDKIEAAVNPEVVQKELRAHKSS
jgi:hypothetical protein